MKPNPGGVLTGEAIVDREKETDLIWKTLQNQSVVLVSERRVGKTSVLRKMEENPRDGWMPLLYIVEGKDHPIVFVEGLYDKLLEQDVIKDNLHRVKKLYTKYAGGETIGSWKFPQIKDNWKSLLRSMVADIVNTKKKVVLMFDELPLMLFKFINSEDVGPRVCMDFLDTLREIRNEYEATKQISFIFCGSIGINLVIKDLKINHNYNADPINNMKIITLDGMQIDGAKLLCTKLSEGEDYQFDDREKVFEYICLLTDRLPFYIQHIFAYIYEQKDKKITKKLVDEAITDILNDSTDKGFFRHYQDRIKTYYYEHIRELALLILDHVCKKDEYWEEGNIINVVKTHKEIESETIRDTIDLLWNDHYLVRERKDDKRSYKFKYTILQNWWKTNRG